MDIMQKFLDEKAFTPNEEVIQPADKLGDDEPRKRILVDFDGVCHAYSQGYRDGTIYDPPAPGTKEALQLLSDKYQLICFSARINAGDVHGKKEMIEWLNKYDLFRFFVDITDKKVPSLLIIDDSAIRHSTWENTIFEMKKLNML